jgi:conjugative relaxase-like TrwC/TraI family protein
MLSIGKLGHGQADYYLQAIGQGIEDYYAGQGEAPGRWLGDGAGELELAGEVDAAALRAVLNGNRPDGSGPLTRSGQRANRVPGFDLTFSAPKSVSLLYGLGDPDVSRAVRDAHEAAIDAALDYMQRHAAMGRRGQGGAISVLGNGFTAAAFRHRTSRAGDPQLHTHVLVANMTRGPDGRWTALDARRLYIHARTGGFLYQAKLRLELTRRLGVSWTPVRHGVAEIDGIPSAIRRAFSRRRAEIQHELDQRGEHTAGAAQIAALDTRRAKDYAVPALALREEWRERSRHLGFDPHAIDTLLRVNDVQPLPREAAERGQDELASPAGLTAHRASFTRRDVVQAWCELLAQGGEVAEIEALADQLLAGDRVVVLAQPPNPLTEADIVRRADGRIVAAASEERRYSTPELLALEAAIINAARTGRGAERAQAGLSTTEQVLASRPELSEDQRTMVQRLLRDGDQIAVVVGRAGTGKTYALDAARVGWQADGFQVIGAALARRAALELRDGAGIDSTSVHALLADLRGHPGELLGPRTVLVLDEAGMIGTRQLAEISQHVHRAGAKLVLVGDPAQLPEIDAGGSLRALAVRLDPVRLSDNRRQREEWEREALELLRSGQPREALATYRQHDRVTLAESAPEQRERIVEDWWTARTTGRDAVMIALRRADVAELNDRARARMAADGRLGAQDLVVHGRPFAAGDEVVCLRNHPGLGVTNGTRGTITTLDPERVELTLTTTSGGVNTLDSNYLQSTTQRGGPSLDYAYAITGHKAQGATVDDALVLGSEALYREWGYVAMSRGRHTNRLYLVAGQPELDDPLQREDGRDPGERVERALQRSAAQISATDAPTQATIAAMSLPQIRDRLHELDREVGVEQRRARRERALRERAARLSNEPAPPPATPTAAREDERALLSGALDAHLRARSLALLVDPPPHLTNELGPVPDELLARRRWRAAAQEIEVLRDRLGFDSRHQALPEQIRDPGIRSQVDALRAQIAEPDATDRRMRGRDLER